MTVEYAAGFFDGEGCVYIRDCKPGLKLGVTIVQNDTRPLVIMQARWGGGISHKKEGGSVLSLHCTKAAAFLRDILPFLIVKKEVAQLGIAFQERRGSRGIPLTPEQKEVDYSTRVAISALNQGRVQ